MLENKVKTKFLIRLRFLSFTGMDHLVDCMQQEKCHAHVAETPEGVSGVGGNEESQSDAHSSLGWREGSCCGRGRD